ncbi:methionine biosynthesis protein MetW [Candidatus Parcubacteria bacterium]|nr:methionine biosynthesis protein MetW [Candidatus Parcubacteria bacterium]
MKYFFFKLRQDLATLFSYPETSLKEHPRVDYDYYWQKRGRKGSAHLSAWQKERADILCSQVSEGDTVLDIGCGDGALLKYVMDKKKILGIGVDMSEPVLATARELGIETHLVDLRNLDAVRRLPRADYVIGFEILEHIPEPEELILTLAAKTRKGMLYSFPNTGYYLHRLRLLFGRFPRQWIVHPAEHVRYWTLKDSRWWVSNLGLKLKEVITYQGLPGLNKLIPSWFAQGQIVSISMEKPL